MPDAPPILPWHPIPSSKTGSTCRVYLMQAGGLDLPKDMVLLPGPNQPNSSLDRESKNKNREMFFVPDFVFVIEHTATGNNYIFDLGMRKDLSHSTPSVIQTQLSNFPSFPKSPVDILNKYGTASQQPCNVKAVIFSHLHFDHIGDAAKHGFRTAELWIGPSTCASARPGYPADKNSRIFTSDLPNNGSKTIIEFSIPSHQLDETRRVAISDAVQKGYYEGINLHEPARGWFPLGAFERVCDLFEDGSAYLIDAPGHMAGRQMVLVRVKTGRIDEFLLLAGDCFHHPAMLQDPLLTARPPFSRASMHSNPETAIDTMFRAKRCAEEDNVWVVGAHDFSVLDAVSAEVGEVHGLVLLTEWRENGWKRQ